MKNLVTENADVLGASSVSLAISMSSAEQILQIALLLLTFIYTLDRYITWKRKK